MKGFSTVSQQLLGRMAIRARQIRPGEGFGNAVVRETSDKFRDTVALTLRGRAVAFPSRSDAGTLFLQREEREEAQAEEEKLDIAVHRHLSDEIPALLTARATRRSRGVNRWGCRRCSALRRSTWDCRR